MSNIKTQNIVAVIKLIGLCFISTATAYQQPNVSLTNSIVIDDAAFSKLYPHHETLLWIDKYGFKEQAFDALDFIANSEDHGLNPNDYHFNLLQQVDPARGPELDKARVHQIDWALTDGLLRLMRDISVGRLDPAVVDPQWSIPRVTFDAVEFLHHALLSNHFKESLDSLVPVSEQYRKLKAAVARYQNYVDNGGWSKVPVTPVLYIGESHPSVPAIRKRLILEGASLGSPRPGRQEYYDKELGDAVKQFQQQHSLASDGVLGPATLHAMNIPAEVRLQQININLERLRWLPDDLGERYIMVNLANYRLSAIEDEKTMLDMRVIVGKTKKSTPSFSSKMTHVVLNPHWYIPDELARYHILRKQQTNHNYFSRSKIRVFERVGDKQVEIDSKRVDWQSVSREHFPYSLVQDPSESNAMGRMKFVLPNQWNIYLHDTPSKKLFNQSKRNFSSGCIRVEDPNALAGFSLRGHDMHRPLSDILSSNESYSVKLKQPLSVYMVYATVWSNGNEIVFSPDSYQRDQVMVSYL